ncbi:MAG: hypothetical protein ABSD20_02115 [Terriglobales bacterium]
MNPPRVSSRGDSWAWVLLVVLVAGGALWVALGSRGPSVPGAVGVLLDRFTQDTALNPGLWLANGSAGGTAASKLTLPPSTAVAPTFAFSNDSGLSLAGAGADLQAATIQSATTVTPPFSLVAEAMAPRAGTGFDLLLTDESANNGLGLTATIDSDNGAAGIKYVVPQGQTWAAMGTLFPSPQANTWYTLSITADDAGKWALEVRDGANMVGSAVIPAGHPGLSKGPFYVVLGQSRTATPGAEAGPVSWRSVQVISGLLSEAAGPPRLRMWRK